MIGGIGLAAAPTRRARRLAYCFRSTRIFCPCTYCYRVVSISQRSECGKGTGCGVGGTCRILCILEFDERERVHATSWFTRVSLVNLQKELKTLTSHRLRDDVARENRSEHGEDFTQFGFGHTVRKAAGEDGIGVVILIERSLWSSRRSNWIAWCSLQLRRRNHAIHGVVTHQLCNG